MQDDRNPERADAETPRAPYRESGSGEDYDPAGNWAAERRLDGPKGGAVPGIEGAPSGAGDGGYGPEGDYTGAAGEENAEVLGEVNADRAPLVDEARTLGTPGDARRSRADERDR